MNAFRKFGRAVLDAFFPWHCFACHAAVGSGPAVCAACWKKLVFLHDPVCIDCGAPTGAYGLETGEKCWSCRLFPLVSYTHRAVWVYGGVSRALVLRLKHGRAYAVAELAAHAMVRMHGPALQTCDFLVPIPLHWTRHFSRRFNQSLLIAQHISRLTGVPVCGDLVRTSRTASQGHKTRVERRSNVKNVFSILQNTRLQGASVALIDDVFTTGATLESASQTLCAVGVKAVRAFTVAKVCGAREKN